MAMGESEDYGSPSEKDAVQERSIRHLNSIKSSMSFRLGNLLVKSVIRPWNVLLLPLSVPLLFWRYAQERLGKESLPESDFFINNGKNSRNCAILFPTNGVGMGHYSRMYSLAMALRRKDPQMEIIFFTTNYVLHPVYGDGFTAYHLPNRQKFESMDARTWNLICEEMLANVFSVHRPSIFVFDGAYPYRGMLNAIKTRSDVLRVWVRRINRKGKDNAPADSYQHFERIVVPGDLIEPDMDELAKWPVDEINLTPPLLSTSREDLSPRGELRNKLGIPIDSNVALVSLGAGEINDISDMRRFVIDGLIEKGVYVIIADSMLKPMKKSFEHELVRVVQSFPIMRNRNCFDFSVIAGGYNSVLECILLRLPSVIIPNHVTSRDDQPGRARKASEIGGSICVEEITRDSISAALQKICDGDYRAEMAQKLVTRVSDDGAGFLAGSLISPPQ
jgi:hypothetical protein